MADNVNIIVQDTINDIVVNAAQIVETIDINVQAAVDVVDIVANPNNYVVNINRIIGEQVQSDWTQNDNQAPDYIKNKPTLAAVATSGDYDDLINKPTIPTNTSDLVNDGENGVDPFITAADVPGLPVLTSGSVLFSNGTTIAQDNSNLFWDDTNNRLGINNPTPFSSVTSTVNGLDIGIYNSVGNEGNLTVRGFASLGGITRSAYGAVGSNYYLDSANALRRRNADSVSVIDFATGGFLFKTAGNAAINTPISLTELMRINANGNVLINTTTDAGFKLDVNGTARFVSDVTGLSFNATNNGGSYKVSGTNVLDYGNGVRIGYFNGVQKITLYTNAGTPQLTVVNSGSILIGTTTEIASSKLTIESTTQGFLPPRMTTTQKNAIATPAAGLVVYDTDLKQLCTYNGTWGNSPFYQQSLGGVRYFTDFDNTATSTPNFTQFTSGAGASVLRSVVSIPNQTSNQIGFCQYQTGTTTTGYATHINEGQVGRQFCFGGGAWVFETFINVEVLSDATNRFRFVTGFGGHPTNASDGNACIFTYDEGGTQNGTIASPNWQCVTSVSDVRTLTTTTTAVSASAWTKLRIEVDAAGTSVTFYINGTLVATHTTNIPTFISAANNRGFNVKQSILKSIGTTNRSVFCDYLLYENNLTTLR